MTPRQIYIKAYSAKRRAQPMNLTEKQHGTLALLQKHKGDIAAAAKEMRRSETRVRYHLNAICLRLNVSDMQQALEKWVAGRATNSVFAMGQA